jgi:hypothetical protein
MYNGASLTFGVFTDRRRDRRKGGRERGIAGPAPAGPPIVLAITFLAAYIPARRASRISPMQALRHE